VALVGGDRTCEIAAHALAAAGVGALRWVAPPERALWSATRSESVSRAAASDRMSAALAAWRGSNPEVVVEGVPLPVASASGAESLGTLGDQWLGCLRGASAVLRSGFDDDPMLGAAVRLGIPAVVVRGREAEGIELVSFRAHGPCPHVPLDGPSRAGAPPDESAAAVVAGHLAAAEILVGLAGIDPGRGGVATARMLRLPPAEAVPHSADIPWNPACFACGGSGQEMSFA
jgi:hypothetical protein